MVGGGGIVLQRKKKFFKYFPLEIPNFSLFIASANIVFNILKKEVSLYWEKQSINSKKRNESFISTEDPCNFHNTKKQNKQAHLQISSQPHIPGRIKTKN